MSQITITTWQKCQYAIQPTPPQPRKEVPAMTLIQQPEHNTVPPAKGDMVKFKVCIDSGDYILRMVLLEDPTGDRVLVESLVDMRIRPVHTVLVKDLEVTYKAVK